MPINYKYQHPRHNTKIDNIQEILLKAKVQKKIKTARNLQLMAAERPR